MKLHLVHHIGALKLIWLGLGFWNSVKIHGKYCINNGSFNQCILGSLVICISEKAGTLAHSWTMLVGCATHLIFLGLGIWVGHVNIHHNYIYIWLSVHTPRCPQINMDACPVLGAERKFLDAGFSLIRLGVYTGLHPLQWLQQH